MSAQPSRIDVLLEANRVFAENYTKPMEMTMMRQGAEPILVLTCMDPRVVPEQFLPSGRGMAVYRNAGGRPNDDVVRTITVLRSLAINAKKVRVLVIHHTDCGMTHLTNDGIKDDVKRRNHEHADRADSINFGSFTADDFEKTILEDVDYLKADPLLEDVEIKGFAFITETGVLKEL